MTRDFYPISMPSIGKKEIEYVTDAVSSGWISSLGPYVTRFENEFAAFCETEHAVSVSNGTVAIHLALHAMGIGAGDEVIMPDLSFVATANATLMTGATPVFCDVEPESLCIDPALIEAKITSRTKAIMPVHLYGHPAEMRSIMEIAQKHGLRVIEDAAEAHGSRAYGRRVGGLGDCATFSFYGNKILTTGEGGMITTNDPQLADRCRFLRDHAMSSSKRYWHNEPGFNYRITNLQAALGCAQLDRSPELLDSRRRLFGWYNDHLGNDDRIRLNRTAPWAENTYWIVCAEIEGMNASERDNLMASMKRRGVDTRPYFYPMSDMPYLQSAATPVAHEVSVSGLNLPTFVDLTEVEVGVISNHLLDALDEINDR